jgi:hypothetical protein
MPDLNEPAEREGNAMTVTYQGAGVVRFELSLCDAQRLVELIDVVPQSSLSPEEATIKAYVGQRTAVAAFEAHRVVTHDEKGRTFTRI